MHLNNKENIMDVTKEQIEEWKSKFKFIYRIPFEGDYIYFHALSRKDYQEISMEQINGSDEFDYELAIVGKCILSDINQDDLKARSGLITILSDNIMTKSGFQTVEAESL